MFQTLICKPMTIIIIRLASTHVKRSVLVQQCIAWVLSVSSLLLKNLGWFRTSIYFIDEDVQTLWHYPKIFAIRSSINIITQLVIMIISLVSEENPVCVILAWRDIIIYMLWPHHKAWKRVFVFFFLWLWSNYMYWWVLIPLVQRKMVLSYMKIEYMEAWCRAGLVQVLHVPALRQTGDTPTLLAADKSGWG